MLVITRRPEESIKIGEEAEIDIKILKVEGNQVRIGITAEESIPVHREEIYNKIKREGRDVCRQSKSKWIRIEDELSPEEEEVLLYGIVYRDYPVDGEIQKKIMVGWLDEDYGQGNTSFFRTQLDCHEGCSNEGEQPFTATHWMPLPKPPED